MQRSTECFGFDLVQVSFAASIDASWLLLKRPAVWVLENKDIYIILGGVFSGSTHEKCAGVYKSVHIVYIGGYVYQQYVYCVVIQWFICTSNMFMMLQVVVVWLCMSYKFYFVIYLCTKVYLSTKIYFKRGWAGLTNTLCKL